MDYKNAIYSVSGYTTSNNDINFSLNVPFEVDEIIFINIQSVLPLLSSNYIYVLTDNNITGTSTPIAILGEPIIGAPQSFKLLEKKPINGMYSIHRECINQTFPTGSTTYTTVCLTIEFRQYTQKPYKSILDASTNKFINLLENRNTSISRFVNLDIFHPVNEIIISTPTFDGFNTDNNLLGIYSNFLTSLFNWTDNQTNTDSTGLTTVRGSPIAIYSAYQYGQNKLLYKFETPIIVRGDYTFELFELDWKSATGELYFGVFTVFIQFNYLQ